jgi:hypothetical protein
MWNFTAVDEAKPVIVFGVAFAGSTCLRSKNADEFAASATEPRTSTPSIATVKVTAEADVFAATIFVTTAVVDEFGAVYRVVLEVAAAVRARTLDVVVAIYFYLCLVIVPLLLSGITLSPIIH